MPTRWRVREMVDLLEDCPNLAVYDFDKVVSYVNVFSACPAASDGHPSPGRSPGTTTPGWTR
jgi:hypothetical protein